MFAIEPIYKSTMNGNYVINISSVSWAVAEKRSEKNWQPG